MCVLEKLAYILTLYNSINVYMIYNKLVEMDGDFARNFKSACFFISYFYRVASIVNILNSELKLRV